MGLISNLPVILLVVILGWLFSREGGQIGALYDMLGTPLDVLKISGTLCLAALALAATAPASRGLRRGIEFCLFLAPALMSVWLFSGHGVLATALATVLALATALGIAVVQGSELPALATRIVVAAAALAIWLALQFAIAASPVDLPRAIGTVAIVTSGLALVAVATQALIRLGAAGIAVLAILGFFLYCNEPSYELAISEPNANRGETAEAPDRAGRSGVSLQQAFLHWLASRNDLEAYRKAGAPYPVFVVTAEGGGGYAAAHAYLFLSKLQRRCPNFAQHVFALVGVSGGSVGNTLFRLSLPDDVNHAEFKGCDGSGRSEADLKLLSADHLSPVVAALIFRDLPNRLLPNMFGGRNRSEALMDSLRSSVGAQPTPYWDHFWNPDNEAAFELGEGPAVVDVATNVFSGRRYVIAPFAFSFASDRFEEGLLDLNWEGPDEAGPRSGDFGLVDAAVASASFPYVTPSLVFSGRLQERIALVDGGYIENSGGETLRDIVAELQDPNIAFEGATINSLAMPRSWKENAALASCEVRLQNVRGDPSRAFPEPNLDPDPCRIDFAINVVTIRSAVPYKRAAEATRFLLDPVSALLNARWRRAETARHDLLSQLCGMRNCPDQTELPQWRFYESVIVPDDLTLPLGWHMPRSAIAELDRFVAPKRDEVFEIGNLPEGSMPAINAWQADVFWTMADNPIMVGYIEDALSPQENP